MLADLQFGLAQPGAAGGPAQRTAGPGGLYRVVEGPKGFIFWGKAPVVYFDLPPF